VRARNKKTSYNRTQQKTTTHMPRTRYLALLAVAAAPAYALDAASALRRHTAVLDAHSFNIGAFRASGGDFYATARDVAARKSGACVTALEDYFVNIGQPINQLARFASANYVVLGEAVFAAAKDPTLIGGLASAAAMGKVTDMGDAATCTDLPGFRYFVASTKSNSPALGLCLPKECSARDLEGLLREGAKAAGYLGPIVPTVVRSGDHRFHLDAVGWCWIVVASIFALLAVVATFAEPAVRKGVKALGAEKAPGDATDYALLEDEAPAAYAGPEWLRCFSLCRNAAAWAKRRGGALSCLDGIRVVSMLLVVYGHSLIWGLQGAGYANVYDILPQNGHGLMATPRGQVIFSAELAVDSFFWLSGFLAAYVTYKVAAAASAKLWVPAAVVHRYLRLTPVYAFVLIFWWKVLRVAGEGAQWQTLEGEYDQCAKWWWTNMLYVNNLVPFHAPAGCYGVTWYLPNDMQFFLLLPFFVLLHHKSKRAGYFAIAASCVASIAYSWWAAVAFDLKIGLQGGADYSNDYYNRPWTRIPPYLIGMATALLYRDAKGRDVLSPRKHTGLLVAGLLLAGLTFFGIYPFDQDLTKHLPHWKHVLYIALSKPGWAVALSCLTWPCFHGRGSLVAFLLELSIWEPIAKLTFVMYLVHPAVLDLFFKSNNANRVQFDEWWWYVVFLGTSVLVAGVSLLVHLLVEQPCANVAALLMPRKGAKKAPPPVEQPLTGSDGDTEVV